MSTKWRVSNEECIEEFADEDTAKEAHEARDGSTFEAVEYERDPPKILSQSEVVIGALVEAAAEDSDLKADIEAYLKHPI